MANKAPTVRDFLARFPTDEACLDHLLEVRYGKHSHCPKCGAETKWHRIKKEPAYVCNHCGWHIHPMAGTPFARTRTPLQMWFHVMFLFTTTRNGVSAKEIQRQLGVTYKTAWRMGHEIRKYMSQVDGDGPLSGHVEIDETWIGGKVRGLPKNAPRTTNKTIVMGMVQRGGDVITRVIPNAKRETLAPHIAANVVPGSVISTDEWKGYTYLPKAGYHHGYVTHSHEEWVNGDTHTQTIEGFWSHLKNAIRSTHIHVSPKHLPKYLAEFEYRFNRRFSGHQMFSLLLSAFAPPMKAGRP